MICVASSLAELTVARESVGFPGLSGNLMYCLAPPLTEFFVIPGWPDNTECASFEHVFPRAASAPVASLGVLLSVQVPDLWGAMLSVVSLCLPEEKVVPDLDLDLESFLSLPVKHDKILLTVDCLVIVCCVLQSDLL